MVGSMMIGIGVVPGFVGGSLNKGNLQRGK